LNDKVEAENGAVGEQGLFIRGTFLGRKPSKPFTFRNSDDKGVEPAKVKIGVGESAYFIVSCGTDEALAGATHGWIKGDVVTVPVVARSAFDGRGPVKFSIPGTDSDSGWL